MASSTPVARKLRHVRQVQHVGRLKVTARTVGPADTTEQERLKLAEGGLGAARDARARKERQILIVRTSLSFRWRYFQG